MSLIEQAGFEYGAPLPRNHKPKRIADALGYRPCLRLEFSSRCVYCGALETEVSRVSPHGGFEVEHFRPESIFGHLRHVYGNLYWSCSACNGAKGNVWPTSEEEACGQRLLDPCADAMGDHLCLHGLKVEAIASSAPGQFTIDELNLNSEYHRHLREERKEIATRIARLGGAITCNEHELSRIADPEQRNVLEQALTTISSAFFNFDSKRAMAVTNVTQTRRPAIAPSKQKLAKTKLPS